MGRIAAERIVAMMKHAHALRNRSVLELPCNSVSCSDFAAYPHSPTHIFASLAGLPSYSALPNPAILVCQNTHAGQEFLGLLRCHRWSLPLPAYVKDRAI